MKRISGVVRSFVHAWRGLRLAFRTERSFRIQIACALGVIAMAFLFPLKEWERVMFILAIGVVLVLELLNSMVERFVDLVKPRLHEYARDVKDLMAASVFVATLMAACIGILVLWPHVADLFARV